MDLDTVLLFKSVKNTVDLQYLKCFILLPTFFNHAKYHKSFHF